MRASFLPEIYLSIYLSVVLSSFASSVTTHSFVQRSPRAPLRAPVLGTARHLSSSGAASCLSMGERPGWASTLREPLLRPTVAGHGMPAVSRRGHTLLPHPYLDAIEARGRGLGSVEGPLVSRPLGIESRSRGQEALDPTMASQSSRTRFKAAFEAYTAELSRQGWESSTGSLWGDWRALLCEINCKGWNEDDFNAELLRHGCGGMRKDFLLGSLIHDRETDARRNMQKERVDSGGGRIDTWAEKMRHACSRILVRRSCRVTPSACTVASTPSAPSEATGACPKQADALGCSGGAVITERLRTNDTSPSTGAKLESKRLIPNSAVRCLLQHV